MDTTPTTSRRPGPHGGPSWLTRLAAIGWRVFVTVAFGAFVVAFAIYLSTVTLSILFAVIAVATLGPFNERLRARGWGGAKAAGGSIGAAVLIVAGALLLIGLALIPFLIDLTQYLHDGLERLSAELAAANLPADAVATAERSGPAGRGMAVPAGLSDRRFPRRSRDRRDARALPDLLSAP